MDRSPFLNHQVETATTTREPVFVFLKRNRLLMFVIFLLSSAAFTSVALLKANRYSSQASVLVKFGREFIYKSEVGEPNTRDAFRWAEIVNSEIEIIRSRELAEAVVEKIGKQLYPEIFAENQEPYAFAKAVQALRENTTVSGVPDSGVIRVSFSHLDAKLAADAINILLENFKDKHLSIFSDYPIEFVQEQTDEYRIKLANLDAKISDYRKENQVFDIEQQRRLLLEQRSALESSLQEASTGIASKDQELLNLELNPSIAISLATSAEVSALNSARGKLLDLQLAERNALQTHTQYSRLVLGIRKDIELVQEFINSSEATISEMAATKVLQERNIFVSQRKASEDQIEKIETTIRRMDVKNYEVQGLERQREVLGENLQEYEARLEQALASEDLDRRKIINVRIIEDAVPAVKPDGLSRFARMILSIFVALLVTLAAGFLRELLRSEEVEEVEAAPTWNPLSPSREKLSR